METEKLTPKESFDLINQVLDKTKSKYEENGQIVMLWGIVTMIAGLSQYFLILSENSSKNNGLVWLITMVPMFIYSIYRGVREGKKRKQRSIDVSGAAWFMAGSMAMLTGFIFANKFGTAFTTVMFLPFCVAGMVSGVFLKKSYMVIMSIIAASIAYAALFIPFMHHPALVAALAFVLFVVPGVLLRAEYKKRKAGNV